MAKYNTFKPWFRAIAAYGISGGAGAVVSAFALPVLDAEHMGFFSVKWWEGLAVFFVANAVLKSFRFLESHPVPGEDKPE